jgi:hypothetical protein
MRRCPDCGALTKVTEFEDEDLDGNLGARSVVSCEKCDWHLYDQQDGFDEYNELEDE